MTGVYNSALSNWVTGVYVEAGHWTPTKWLLLGRNENFDVIEYGNNEVQSQISIKLCLALNVEQGYGCVGKKRFKKTGRIQLFWSPTGCKVPWQLHSSQIISFIIYKISLKCKRNRGFSCCYLGQNESTLPLSDIGRSENIWFWWGYLV